MAKHEKGIVLSFTSDNEFSGVQGRDAKFSDLLWPDASRLDAVQGSSEARTELYPEVLRGSTGVADEVMRQESAEFAAQPESQADGGGVW